MNAIPQSLKDLTSFLLPVAESEVIIDIFKYCININSNLLNQRDIEIQTTDATTNRIDTDVVMQEPLLTRVTGQL